MSSLPSDQNRKRFIRSWELFVGIFFGLLFGGLFYFGFFSDLENRLLDRQFRWRPAQSFGNDVVLITISDKCIKELGIWPFRREFHAKVVKFLKEAGARVIAFDFLFNEPSTYGEEDDKKFAAAIRDAGNVILPLGFSQEMVLNPENIDEFVKKVVPREPIPLLKEAASGLGFIDIEHREINQDGNIRQLYLDRDLDGTYFYHLGLVTAAKVLGIPISRGAGEIVVGDRHLPLYSRIERSKDTGPISSFIINYTGLSQDLDRVYYSDIFNQQANAVSNREVLFRNKAVIIGTSAQGGSNEDLKFSPYGAIAGMEIHAHLIRNVLSGKFLHRFNPLLIFFVIFYLALSLSLLLWWKRGWSVNLAAFLLWAGWFSLGVFLFRVNLILELAPILAMLPIQWATVRMLQQFYDLQQSNQELAKKVEELSVLNEISEAIKFMEKLSQTLDSILSRTVGALGAERGSIFLVDERYEGLLQTSYVEKSVVLSPDGSIEARESPASNEKYVEALLKIAPRLFNDLSSEPSLKEFLTAEAATHSMLCVPLQVKSAISRGTSVEATNIGLISIVNKTEGEFDHSDLQLALTMANQASVIIENARLYNLATIDGLTGLIVHRHFQVKLDLEFRRAKRTNRPISLIMTDIDHFKKFNDTWGHQTGDDVLKGVAKYVKSTIRDADIAARYGGEEFAIVLPETDEEGARLLAERVRQKIESSIFPGPKGDLKVTISLGVSSIPLNPAESPLEMIKLADEAMYAAKHGGRNQVRLSEVRPSTPPETPS